MPKRGMGQDDSEMTALSATLGADQGIEAPPSIPLQLPTPIAIPTPVISVTAPSTPAPTSTGSSPSVAQSIAQVMSALAPAAAAGAQIYRSVQTPSVVPGTAAIYNPATGQFYNPQTGQVVSPAGQPTGGTQFVFDPYMVMGAIAVGVLALLFLGRR
jgi:hypothetical protein